MEVIRLKNTNICNSAENKKAAFAKATAADGGAERIRTAVQTYSPKAFYMLIS
jgi:hypothetical protein